MQRVIEYDVEQCFQTAGMSASIRTNIYFRKIKINISLSLAQTEPYIRLCPFHI